MRNTRQVHITDPPEALCSCCRRTLGTDVGDGRFLTPTHELRSRVLFRVSHVRWLASAWHSPYFSVLTLTTPGSDSTISYMAAANCVHSVGAVAEADRSSRHKFAPEGCQDACYGKVKTWCRETRGEISTYYYLHSRQTESKLCDRLSQVDLLFFSIIHI